MAELFTELGFEHALSTPPSLIVTIFTEVRSYWRVAADLGRFTLDRLVSTINPLGARRCPRESLRGGSGRACGCRRLNR